MAQMFKDGEIYYVYDNNSLFKKVEYRDEQDRRCVEFRRVEKVYYDIEKEVFLSSESLYSDCLVKREE